MKMHEILRWRAVMVTLSLGWVVAAASAQDAKKAVEPEYVGVVFLLDQDAGKLVPLERQQGNIQSQSKLKALGFGGASVSVGVMFPGAKSPVRFRADQKLEFVFKIDAASKGVEPSQLVNLDVLQSRKDVRLIETVKGGGFSVKTTTGSTLVMLDCAPYGDSSLKCRPAQKLASGEYVFSTKAMGLQGFLFGIN